VEERWFRPGAVAEWLAAAAVVGLVLWIVSVPIQRAVGPRLQAAMADAGLVQDTPPGVPSGAMLVPVMLLLDGREVRQGDLRTHLDTILPPKFAEGPPVVSSASYGERHARGYRINGTKIFVVCERAEPNGPMRVAGIYLP
jgi:hypothetical protein